MDFTDVQVDLNDGVVEFEIDGQACYYDFGMYDFREYLEGLMNDGKTVGDNVVEFNDLEDVIETYESDYLFNNYYGSLSDQDARSFWKDVMVFTCCGDEISYSDYEDCYLCPTCKEHL